MRFRVLIAGSLAALISCRSGTEPTFLDPLTIALQQVSWAEFNNYQHHISDFGLPPVFPISTYDPRVCAYTAQDGAFTCSTQGENAFGWTVRYFLYDGAGAAQSAFDERTTDRVRVVVDADGRIPGPSVGGQVPNLTYDRVIHHHSDFTLSGMLGAERSVSGTTTDHDTVGVAPLLSVVDASVAVDRLAFVQANDAFPYAGALSIDVETRPQATSSSNAHASLKFDGIGVAQFDLRNESVPVSTTSCTFYFLTNVQQCVRTIGAP